jgi:hypothetical protein
MGLAPRPGMSVLLRLVWAGLLVSTTALAEPRFWEPVSEAPGLKDASAVAVDSVSGRVAVGDRGGVRWFLPGATAERVLRRGPVHDLEFGEGGVLYAATARGLFRISPRGKVSYIALGPAGGLRVTRLAVLGSLVAGAGEGGLYVAADGRSFARVRGEAPAAPVAALALANAGDAGERQEIWWVGRGALIRGTLVPSDPPRLVDTQRLTLPAGELSRAPLDLELDAGGARAAVLGERRVALLREQAFEVVAPAWPAGARAARLVSTSAGIWVGTDRGLVVGPGWDGPWRRAAPPAGGFAVAALAASPGRIWLAGSRGLLQGRETQPGVAESAASQLFAERLRTEPTIQEVHAAVLRHQDLGARRMRRLARGVGRRGWLPDVTVRGAYGDLRSGRVDEDQVVFSTGTMHDLVDTQNDHHRDWEGTLALTWSLGDIAYHPESIDVSRESREWIELRDEVLDEVNQLYFERRRALLELATAPGSAAEAARRRLRADELAAGLDAWTGGWFGFRSPPLSGSGPSSSPPQPQENSP